MFEDRGPSIFPHPASAWWVPILLVVGWGPLFALDIIYPDPAHIPINAGEGFAMPWGMGITLPCSVLVAVAIPVQAFRLLMYFLNRPKLISK
jgi:hypothetical protein